MQRPDLPTVDPADYEDVDIDDSDNPEWTAADFARARPMAEVWPASGASQPVTLEVDTRVIDFFQTEGGDWRARMADTLAKAAARRRA